MSISEFIPEFFKKEAACNTIAVILPTNPGLEIYLWLSIGLFHLPINNSIPFKGWFTFLI
jgi:hypothetical protein